MTGWVLLLWLAGEVAAVVWVGERLGVLATVALFLGTSLLGLLVLRLEGVVLLWRLLRWMDESAARGEVEGPPVEALAGSLPWLLGGLLLLLPGFLSDALGLLLLLPPGRWLLARRIERWVHGYWRERATAIRARYRVHPLAEEETEEADDDGFPPRSVPLLDLPPPDPEAH